MRETEKVSLDRSVAIVDDFRLDRRRSGHLVKTGLTHRLCRWVYSRMPLALSIASVVIARF